MMDRGLDHLVYATPDLDASVTSLAERFGAEPVPGGAHPGWGTRNALIGMGIGVYLEIIGPDPSQPDPKRPRPFLIDDLAEARLLTWAFRHPDPESLRDRLDAVQTDTRDAESRNTPGDHKVRLGSVRAMSRARPDGSTLRWRLSDPTALPAGGVVPFVIDWGTTPHPSSSLPNQCKLIQLVAGHPDPVKLRPVLDVFRPLLDDPHVEILLVAAAEPEIRARLQTPNGEIDLS